MPMVDMKEDSPATINSMQRKQALETSGVVNSEAGQHSVKPGWYREMRVFKWSWQGLSPLLIQEVQARIAVSNNERTHADLIDTVKGYRPGNWIYEWSQEAALRMMDGKRALEVADLELAKHHFLQSCLLYTVAGHPHLRGDKLANDAHLLANQAYQQAGLLLPNPLKIERVPFQGREVQCYLHLPKTDDPVPLVIMAGGGDALQTDYLRVFQDFLEPKGVALLTVDMPGIGYSAHWTLSQETSALYEAVVEHMSESPYVLADKIALMGLRIGGHAAVRTAVMMPDKVAAVAAIGAVVHDALVEPKVETRVSQMLIDEIASRLGVDSARPHLLAATLTNYSLRRQGLLGLRKINVPMLGIAHPQDLFGTVEDAKLIAQSSYGGEVHLLKRPTFASAYDAAFAKACDWITRHLT
ncbi:alpha/beta hydrolase [Echinimonas agarilytica]|uniref:Alpha/beta hydrolase n=1 Tax=Echinimonas agarilytica TaxID=1215918 RepID=A0AA41W8A2_9GAMM|nr:alpha/beta hydrolase [Echinimonas agarilytica]MCM2680256.1 alpha/beta hydrolase [Echinimonas agarilytica]